MVLFTGGCDQTEMPNIGGIVGPEDDLYGCEGATLYDWDNLEFATSLDENETTWIAFDLEETTLFNVSIDQAGFHCAIFDGCAGELGLPPPEYVFESEGDSQEVGILTTGVYYLEITNLRNRVDFTFSIALNNITYGCTNNDAENFNPDANVDDGSCIMQDCTTQWFVDNMPDGAVNDCDGNCSPVSWIGDGYCDDGSYYYWNEFDEQIPINLMCAEFNWDEGDCEAIDEGCTASEIEDCEGNCAPTSWIGDGFCDDGSWNHNGIPIFLNCDLHNFDGGDCDEGLNRQMQQPKYPNGRIPIGQ